MVILGMGARQDNPYLRDLKGANPNMSKDELCAKLAAALAAACNAAEKKEIQQAQKFLGCRDKAKRKEGLHGGVFDYAGMEA